MLVQNNGRTIINPNLKTRPVQGYEQVSITGQDAAGYANTLEQYYATPKEDRVADFGTGPQVKGVNTWLRGLNGQLSGGEFISTDAQIHGALNGVDETFLRTHRSASDTASGLASNNVAIDGPQLLDR